jgi:AcrR family transcriptional regulator
MRERQKSREKTQAILKAAMKEFLAHGYAATSMDRLAKSAGVSKATIYNHFQDKEQLFNAVIQDLVKEKFQPILSLDNPQSFPGKPQEVLQQIALTMLKHGSRDRTLQNFIRIIIGESGRFPELAKAYIYHIASPSIMALTKYLKFHPELNLTNPEATVRIYLGTLFYYVMLQELLYGKDIIPLEREELTETLTQLITHNY